MNEYDEKLYQLRELIRNRKQIEKHASELQTEERRLSENVRILKISADDDRTKLEKLEGHSIFSFFATIFGRKQKLISEAREKAQASQAEYDNAVQQIEALQKELRNAVQQRHSAQTAELRYSTAIDAKAEAIKLTDSADKQPIIELEKCIDIAERTFNEINEAFRAGQSALNIADNILSSLDAAKDWSTVDILGGGLVSDLAKHEHLDSAQNQLEYLKKDILHFQKELGDIDISADLRLDIDGFLRAADFFFDGLWADLSVRSRITQSIDQISYIRQQISDICDKLAAQQWIADAALKNSRRAREKLVENAVL